MQKKTLNAAMAAKYAPCKVLYGNKICDMIGMNIKENMLLIEVDYMNTGVYVIKAVDADQCQLLLTPISKISDLDAIEVGRMADFSEKYRRENYGCDKDNMLLIGKEISSDFVNDYGDPARISASSAREIIDYLLSTHHDLHNLIEQGIAVDVTLFNGKNEGE